MTNSAQGYALLPFQFGRLDERRYLLTNFVGEHLVLPRDELDAFARHRLSPNGPAYRDLKSRHFLFDGDSEAAVDLLAAKYRTKQAFLSRSTALFMFVTTLRCDHHCTYCQVSRRTKDAAGCDMSPEVASRAVEFMFRSPSPCLKVEFQGGESLLHFDLVRLIVELVETRNSRENRDVAFVLTSNLSALSPSVLQFCADHNVCISTSLDGPADLHNANRPKPGGDSHAEAAAGIAAALEALGPGRVSALMTATRASLNRGPDIVDEYRRLGLSSVFLRMINPYGCASSGVEPLTAEGNADESGPLNYTADEWLKFYRDTLDYILRLADFGVEFREEFSELMIRKMLSPYAVGFVDLQSPAGIGIAGIVFNYDGDVYGSDEGRMLAEMGDRRFRMGNLLENTYEEITSQPQFIADIKNTMAECVPGCNDCAFRPYCGSDPVRHYRTQGDVVGCKPASDFCRKNSGVVRHLVGLLQDDPCAAGVLHSWIA